jgi:GTPase SAR1 family protein
VWDCSAQERYRAVTRAFCKGADAVVVVYDITNLASFGQVQPWVERIRAAIDRDPDAERDTRYWLIVQCQPGTFIN